MPRVSLTLSADKDLSPGEEQNSLPVGFHFYPCSLSKGAGFLAAVPGSRKVHGPWAAPRSFLGVLGGRSTSCQLVARYHHAQPGRSV